MPIAQAQATMKSVAELTASVDGVRGKRVCLLLSGMLERSMLDHIDLQVRADILKNENVQLTADIAKLREKNVELNELNAYLQRQIYGKKSEPLPKPNATPDDPADPAVAVDEAKAAAARELQKKARAMLKAAHANGQPKEKGSGTEALLTQETVRRRVPEGLTCLCCSGPVKDLGLAHTATEIDCIPATYIKRTYLLHRGGCDCGGVSFIMPGPERGLEKTTASPRMIADCAVDKFLWHMPVHRQEAYLKLHGVDLSRSIMNGWILRGAMVCAPLWRALCKANRAQPVKQCDETPVCVVKGEESKMAVTSLPAKSTIGMDDVCCKFPTGDFLSNPWHRRRSARDLFMTTKQSTNACATSSEAWPAWLRPNAGGVSIALSIQPNAKRNEVVGAHGDVLKIKIAAPPVEGAATEALLAFLSTHLGVKRQAVEILRGATNRQKVVLVHGITADAVLDALQVNGRQTAP